MLTAAKGAGGPQPSAGVREGTKGLDPKGWPAAPRAHRRVWCSGEEGLALIALAKRAGNLSQHPLNADPPRSGKVPYVKQGVHST